MTSRRVLRLLDEFAAAETEFLNQEFLAPVVRGAQVRVRMGGVVMNLNVDPADYQGWGVFCPISHRKCILSREATIAQRCEYIKCMRRRNVILVNRIGSFWESIPAYGSDRDEQSVIPVRLVQNAQVFDTVSVGFDGANGWFDRVDMRGDPKMSAWMREQLAGNVEVAELKRKGLTAAQRRAYQIKFVIDTELREQLKVDRTEQRLREALGHAGADLVGYVEHRGGYRVTYSIDGTRHVSSVDQNDLTVQTAGICLSGEDQKFDLASLVGVLREPDAYMGW